jgi:hypothetical protein
MVHLLPSIEIQHCDCAATAMTCSHVVSETTAAVSDAGAPFAVGDSEQRHERHCR